jgi:hypothetical protein
MLKLLEGILPHDHDRQVAFIQRYSPMQVLLYISNIYVRGTSNLKLLDVISKGLKFKKPYN